MFIYIAGVSGAGKTTLVQAVAKRVGSEALGGTANIMAYHGLTDMEYFQEGLITCYETWFPPYEAKQHQRDRDDPTTWRLMDLHFHYFRPNGDRPRPVQPYDPVNLKCVMLLEPPVETVLERRIRDREKRPDRSFDRLCIRQEQNIEASGARAFCCNNRILQITLLNLDLESSIQTVVAQMTSRS